jgi:predicted RNA binding protein YcfA (HicA-like mRNA interferase family)
MFSETLTSEQMEKLLTQLGYRLSPSKGPQRVFENPEYDAVMLLPPADKEKYARMEHLMTLRRIAIEKGIVDETTFERLLSEVQRKDESVAA